MKTLPYYDGYIPRGFPPAEPDPEEPAWAEPTTLERAVANIRPCGWALVIALGAISWLLIVGVIALFAD